MSDWAVEGGDVGLRFLALVTLGSGNLQAWLVGAIGQGSPHTSMFDVEATAQSPHSDQPEPSIQSQRTPPPDSPLRFRAARDSNLSSGLYSLSLSLLY